MSKETLIIGLVTSLILCISTVAHAAQYYDQYPGNGFLPTNESKSYYRNQAGYLQHNDNTDTYYSCPINFNIPYGSTNFIKSIGIRFKDNEEEGWLNVQLMRHNLYTGADHLVADWQSSGWSASSRTASEGTLSGVKLIDTKKFVYWLRVFFYTAEEINPGSNLILYQVRIHYGT